MRTEGAANQHAVFGYPSQERRGKTGRSVFIAKYMTALRRSGDLPELGEAVCLLVAVVSREDDHHYRRPAKYTSEQLADGLGWGRKTLVRHRARAVELGWLYYRPGRKGVPGTYWGTIPNDVLWVKSDPETDRENTLWVKNDPETGLESGPETGHLPNPLPVTRSSSCPGRVPDGSPKKTRGKPTHSPDDMAVASWMWGLIHDMQPERKPPKLDEWATTVRLMRERDGRSHQDIRDLFARVHADGFWRVNVLSPETLRKKWDDLTLKLSRDRNSKTTHPSRVATKEDAKHWSPVYGLPGN